MKDTNILDDINSPENVNQSISKDEEGETSNGNAMRMAEELILQLPATHGGRNEWLKQHGRTNEAALLRDKG